MELCFGPTLPHGQEVGGPKQTAQVWAGCPWGWTGSPVPFPGAFSQSQAKLSLRERDGMASAARAQAKFLWSWAEAEAMLSYLWGKVRGLGTRLWARRPYFWGKEKQTPLAL